ncbi:MAG: ribonuclease H-like domain-containing protein [Deltaproteobacteria bacterium]|jgi:uncharacterized protein YprB with RNaseH-like and TPR domain|nr:ribonuclease H-like domain-containing protein [Deltaproteobacteria bacterium]
MLSRTFMHIPGVSSAKEKKLWGLGILDHDRLLASGLVADPTSQPDWHVETKLALKRHDHGYFTSRLPPSEHYRLALDYPTETAFLDIETTGMNKTYDHVTVIGWSMGGAFDVMVHGRDDPGKFIADMARAKAMVTFNGRTFDVPVIARTYPGISLPRAHADLRYLCKKVDLSGGQKAVEAQIGLERQQGKGSGEQAVILWHAFKRGRSLEIRKAALRDLIVYNHADVEGMKPILDICVERLTTRGLLPGGLGCRGLFGALASRPDFGDGFPFSLEPF